MKPRWALALLGVLWGCRQDSAPPSAWVDSSGTRWRTLAGPGRGTAGFTRLAAATTGIEFTNTVSEEASYRNRHLMHGSGVAIGDVDGDGLPDIYLSRIEGPNALYLNLGGWKFREVAVERGVALGDRPSTGTALADVDGDGDLDLVVTAMGGRNTLFLNDGAGKFTDASEAAGVAQPARGSTTAAFADVDGDGDLDLYIANYRTRTMLDSLPPQERAFDQIVKQTGQHFEVIPGRRADYQLIERKEFKGITLVQRADPDWFFLNDGAGHFAREPIAGNPRFRDEAGAVLAQEPEDFGLAARFYDVNGDGAPELYVANDFEDPDQFWINDGHGQFRLIAKQAIRRTANSDMAVDFADIDRDGAVDLFEVDMLANDGRRLKTQLPTHTTFTKQVGEYLEPAQWQRNALLLNRGDGTFAEIADYAGVAASGWSWSTMFLDVDLDGFEDLLIGNGHTWDLMDADIQERLKSRVSGVDWRKERQFYPALKLKNVAFRNRGNRTFEDAGETWRWGTEEDISHGMAAGDLDGDGDLDVVVNRLGAPVAVMRNDATAPRVAVRLKGNAPNTHGIGARIRVEGGAVPEQEREVTAGGLYLSASDQELTFATGTAASVILSVRWRDGRVTRIGRAVPGRLYEIAEDSGGAAAHSEESPPSAAPLFEDVSPRLGARHTEVFFNDYVRQPLLDHQLSQEGPGVSWIDMDRDGREDLVVPDGAGGELAWYRNELTRFVRVPLGYPADRLDYTMALPFPDSSTAGVSVLIGRSTYRSESLQEAMQTSGVARLVLGDDGRKVAHALAVAEPDRGSVGAMALADIDGDGDLDLFVAGRVLPGAYPHPAASRIYRNDGGTLVRDHERDAAFERLGLVSAAVFTDLNGDGWPDLAVATEWGPIRAFLNQRGTFTEVTAAMGLASRQGLWQGLTAGDFDGDGRMDLAAMNWGRNLTFTADSATPRFLYFGRFGLAPSVDLVPAGFDARLHAVAPQASFATLSWALPSLRRRMPTFADYSGATIEQVLGPAAARAERMELTTLDHTLFLNRGERFEAVALPDEAQFAPGFAAVAADFDGDGREDLFVGQNFSQTETGTPRFDAGRGLLLLGDGKGGVHPMPGQRSGIVVYGDQRGAAAADYDGDGRVDLAVSQNAAETRLFHNKGAAVGLRVRLIGGPANPLGVGAAIRVRYGDAGHPDDGPVREIHAGSGHWSVDGAVALLGLKGTPKAVWVRWPGGREAEVAVPPGTVEITIREPGS